MRLSRFPTLIIILSIPISLYAQPPEILSDEAYQAVLQFYQYDEGMPLDARVVEKQLTPDYIREKVVVAMSRRLLKLGGGSSARIP